jgi:DNA-binding MarR family transcriptional regulator
MPSDTKARGNRHIEFGTIARNLDGRGTRATEIAKRAGITKTIRGQLIGQLEEIGLIERIPDPDGKRARIVHFTPAGLPIPSATP